MNPQSKRQLEGESETHGIHPFAEYAPHTQYRESSNAFNTTLYRPNSSATSSDRPALKEKKKAMRATEKQKYGKSSHHIGFIISRSYCHVACHV